MTKENLIFSWNKSQGSFRDMIVAFVLVTILFTGIFGAIGIRFVSPRDKRSGSASILRFRDDDLGRSWMLQAEEDGPFPGRLEYGSPLAAGSMEGRISWNDYRSELREISDEEPLSREQMAPKGVRVFPSRHAAAKVKPDTNPVPGRLVKTPVLSTYDSAAVAWMPEELPDFAMPADAGKVSSDWRFAVNLREDGSVRESISLGGGDDAGQAALEQWLRGVRFKRGEGDRWLGLRVEFMNRTDNGTVPE